MSLIDMIESAAGAGALQQIGARVGLSPEQLQAAIGGLAPALAPKLAQHAATGGLAGPLEAGLQEPGSDAAEAHGNDVLGQIFGSKDVSRSVAADASARTGIGTDTLKALLPQLASVAVAVLAAHQAGSGGGAAGGLGGLLGGLGGGDLGGLLGRLGR